MCVRCMIVGKLFSFSEVKCHFLWNGKIVGFSVWYCCGEWKLLYVWSILGGKFFFCLSCYNCYYYKEKYISFCFSVFVVLCDKILIFFD